MPGIGLEICEISEILRNKPDCVRMACKVLKQKHLLDKSCEASREVSMSLISSDTQLKAKSFPYNQTKCQVFLEAASIDGFVALLQC